MTAIKTKYLGPTNHRGSRIKATTANGHSITVSWDYSLETIENHKQAALALCDKMDWPYAFQTGALDDSSYVHVFINLRAGDDYYRTEARGK